VLYTNSPCSPTAQGCAVAKKSRIATGVLDQIPQEDFTQIKAAIYLRRSEPGEERKNYSIDSQRGDTTKFVTDQGGEVVRVYSDPGGKSYTLYRPVYQQLVRDAQTGLFDTVVVGRYDRFSRSQTQQGAAINQLREYGV